MGCVKRSGVLCGVSCKLMTNYDNERMKVIVGGTQCRIQTHVPAYEILAVLSAW
jgi:hypothetical protein